MGVIGTDKKGRSIFSGALVAVSVSEKKKCAFINSRQIGIADCCIAGDLFVNVGQAMLRIERPFKKVKVIRDPETGTE